MADGSHASPRRDRNRCPIAPPPVMDADIDAIRARAEQLSADAVSLVEEVRQLRFDLAGEREKVERLRAQLAEVGKRFWILSMEKLPGGPI